MSTTEALETLWAAAVTDVPLVKREQALDVLRSLLRSDWAVRVLDAWAATGKAYTMTPPDAREPWGVVTDGKPRDGVHFGKTPDDARHAAALAVFPTLPADVRAELGECP